MNKKLPDSPQKEIDDTFDQSADHVIQGCLNPDAPQSFFLFAGAGSGKTGSLVESLKYIRKNFARRMEVCGQKVAVITYTNAATDEIMRRTQYDSLFQISTIHSFVWSLIQGLNNDIKLWLKEKLEKEIEELNGKISKARSRNRTLIENERKLESKARRLRSLDFVIKFTYSPNGDNVGLDALNHSEVIQIGEDFISSKELFQHILVNRFPILLIDESQDTNKKLMKAFFALQSKYKAQFSLGLFGDTMQQIYLDGMPDLEANLPKSWKKPVKVMNHRSQKRIVDLINSIRNDMDNQAQRPRHDKSGGFVRLFLADTSSLSKEVTESLVREKMYAITLDENWKEETNVKHLVLEHHMAASRLGFSDLFEPIYSEGKFKSSFIAGTMPELKFFSDSVWELVHFRQKNDAFGELSLLRKSSPLLEKKNFNAGTKNKEAIFETLKTASDDLFSLWNDGNDPTLHDVLRKVSTHGLFSIPNRLAEFADSDVVVDHGDDSLSLWDKVLRIPMSQIVAYKNYVSGEERFDTHQGVKGLEFPRVMVVIDDSSANGNTFSYEKVFGLREKTPADLKNEQENKDTSILRTQRLLYVTFSRAEESLAVVAYVSDVETMRKNMIAFGWFLDDEIIPI